MTKSRASSDLLSSSYKLQKITTIECLTLDGGKINEHSLDIKFGLVQSDEQAIADPILSAIVSIIHNL